MQHLVQFSTGAGSAEVALRVYDRHPTDTVLITADTMVEHADNWRFAREIVALMPRAKWVILRDGRTPMEVGRDHRCVPNNRMAVCSRILKRELIRGYIDEHFDPGEAVVYLGYDWTEEHRFAAAVEPWRPFEVRCPLMAPPYLTKAQILDSHREQYGIEPVILYTAGFSHANCGGGCVRGGQDDWARLLFFDRETFLAWEAEENKTRSLLGKDVAILRDRRGGATKPLPLAQFRARLETDASLFDEQDTGACGCDPWSGEE